ncbi:hypothetical protein HK098_003171 [Nowakowskiella sp. JEL0407]|nr:hypothetical protein HK098_003171 [Nowakowskiella sp. JEL0407]
MKFLLCLIVGTFAVSYVAAGYQCGGKDYHGSTECPPGFECVVMDETFSLCLPISSPSPTVDIVPLPVGYQCGGAGYTGSTVCESGSYCAFQDETFSLCLPTPSPSPIPSSPSPIVPSPSPITSPIIVKLGEKCAGVDSDSVPKICESGSYCHFIDDYKSVCRSLENGYIPMGGEGFGSNYQCSPETICKSSSCGSIKKCYHKRVPLGGQCGGAAYAGQNKCEDGLYCKFVSNDLSQCVSAANIIIPLGGQCGGIGYQGPTICLEGSECVVQDVTFSICLPSSMRSGSKCGGKYYESCDICQSGLYCTFQSEDLSICLPRGTNTSSTTSLSKSATQTTLSTPSTVSSVVPLGYQCGGIGYTGSTQCENGTRCEVQDSTFSICLSILASPSPIPITTTSSIPTTWTTTKPLTSASPVSKIIPLGQQCGGLGFDSTNKACETGAYCYPIDDFKSICKSLVNGYIPFGGLCGDASGKQCSPGTVCDTRCSGVYKCRYPLVPEGGQCGGVGYVGGNWCVSGAICKPISSTVSQCLHANTPQLEFNCLDSTLDCQQGTECAQQDPTFGICLPQTAKFGQQCGGKNYDGCDKCDPYGKEGATYCTYQNDSLSICLPAGYTTTLPVTTPKTTTSTTTLKTTQLTNKTTTKSTTKTTTTSKSTTKTTTKATPSAPPKCANKWEQCGGINWTGAKCCIAGTSCHQLNPYYFQCL